MFNIYKVEKELRDQEAEIKRKLHETDENWLLKK